MSFKKHKISKTKNSSIVDTTLKSFKDKYVKARKRNFFSGILLGLGGVFIIGFFAFFTFSKISAFSFDFSFVNLLNLSGFSNIDPQKEKINILLTGMGGAGHEGAELTDTIILASLNTKKKTVTMLSIPRDLYVEYPTSGEGKINELFMREKFKYSESRAMAFLEDKVEEITGEKTDYFLNIDFDGFVKFVDLLGGIEVDIPYDLVDKQYPDSNWGYETFKINKGKQVLDGETALKYSRSRHSTSDFDRSLRQQLVIKAIKNKLLDLDYIGNSSKMKALFYTMSNNIKTDLGIRDIVGIAALVKGIDNNKIFTFNLNDSCQFAINMCEVGGFLYTPQRDYFNGAAVLLTEDSDYINTSNYNSINRFSNLIFNYPEVFIENVEINVVNSTKVNGLANRFAIMLKKYGFNIPEKNSIMSTKDRFDKTKVYYKWNPETESGVNPESKTLEALGQFLFTDNISKKNLNYTKNPQAEIEVVLGQDYQLFIK